jgi:hypothetical protein
MYLGEGRTYYQGTEQRHTRAPFLIVMVYDEPIEGKILGKRSKLRGIVRQVAMHQCGHFMMGSARVGPVRLSLSGTYGSDGLPLTVDKATWECGTPVPDELEAKFWEGGGHNDAGSEGPDFFHWGRELAGLPSYRQKSHGS